MDTEIAIRSEQAGDAEVIADVVARAYADIPYSDRREHLMIDRLRRTDAFIPALSLLAAIDGAPVGHILLTRAHIRSGDAAIETLALAPLSVVPDAQRRGVGAALVQAAHARATALGFGSIVLVGIPAYYPRFGYGPLADYPIALPFAAPAANCMVRLLRPHALDGVCGIVDYAPGWLDH